MQISSAPPTICGTAATAVAFNASKSASTFLCQLSNADAGATQSSEYLTASLLACFGIMNLTSRRRICSVSGPRFQVFPCLMHI